jgi:S1-C subfamily serine protease
MIPARRACVVGLLLLTAGCAVGQSQTQQPASPPPPIQPPSLESIIERVRPSIVRVVVTYEFRVKEHPEMLFGGVQSGTGFIFDSDGHIATAGHVVSLAILRGYLEQSLANAKESQHLTDDSVRITRIQVLLPVPSGTTSIGTLYDVNRSLNASVLAEDDAIDVAVLAGDANPLALAPTVAIVGGTGSFQTMGTPKVARLQTTPPHDGDMISVSGFPLNIPVLVTNTGFIATAFFIDERGRSLYLGDISVNHGNSGGPAYSDKDGSVIGCVTEYRPAPEGNSRLTVIVPIQRVLDLLTRVKQN